MPRTETEIGHVISYTVHINIYLVPQHKSEISSGVLGLAGPYRGKLGHPSASSYFRAKTGGSVMLHITRASVTREMLSPLEGCFAAHL